MRRVGCILVIAAAVVLWFAGRANAQVSVPVDEIAGCPWESARFYPCAVARARTFNPPRAPDGRPDLRGLWEAPTTTGSNNVEAFDPAKNPQLNTPQRTASLIVDPPDGRIPYQPWAAAYKEVLLRKFIDPYAYCFPAGVPRQMYQFRPNRIFQFPESLVILSMTSRAVHRVIPTDGRPRVVADVKLWMGDSRGRWEGNTLVVEVTNLTDETWLSVVADFHSDALRVVERYRLVDSNTILYEATMEDPTVYTRPWTIAIPLVRNQEPGYEMWEEQCHEGQRDIEPLRSLGYRRYPGLTRGDAAPR